MSFKVKALGYFVRQIKHLDAGGKRRVREKIGLIKENPYRFKRIHSKKFSKVFRVRLNLRGKETRLIYVLLEPNIILACLLERKRDYKDLEKYLKKI
jgi:mRNA-degrading endonuclease RelE of RelBE toxin-antitoxin system